MPRGPDGLRRKPIVQMQAKRRTNYDLVDKASIGLALAIVAVVAIFVAVVTR